MPDKIVDVPSVGIVSFPGEMSDDDVSVAIKKQYPQPQQQESPSIMDRVRDFAFYQPLPENQYGHTSTWEPQITRDIMKHVPGWESIYGKDAGIPIPTLSGMYDELRGWVTPIGALAAGMGARAARPSPEQPKYAPPEGAISQAMKGQTGTSFTPSEMPLAKEGVAPALRPTLTTPSMQAEAPPEIMPPAAPVMKTKPIQSKFSNFLQNVPEPQKLAATEPVKEPLPEAKGKFSLHMNLPSRLKSEKGEVSLDWIRDMLERAKGEEGAVTISQPKSSGLLTRLNEQSKNIAMSTGIPGTGISPHGINILRRSLVARPDMLKEVLFNMAPSRAGDVIDSNIANGEFKRFIKAGMQFSAEEHEALKNPVEAEQGLTGARAFLDKAMKTKDNLFTNPTFGRLIPASKIVLAQRVEKELIDAGAAPEDAVRGGAKFANELYGGIDIKELGISPGFHKAMKNIFFAPDFSVYSPYQMGKGVVKGLMNPDDPMGKPYRNLAKNLGVALVLGNVINKVTSGHFMHQNDPRHIFDLEIAHKDEMGKDKLVSFPFMSSMFGVHGILGEAAAATAMNRADEIPRMFMNRVAPGTKAVGGAVLNRNWAGNPIYGPDKYGYARPGEEQLSNLGRHISESLLPGSVMSGYDLAQGRVSPETAAIRGLSLPLNIYGEMQPPKEKRPSTRIRLKRQ